MELIKLLGIVIVVIGFALKKDSILIILSSAIVTVLVGGLGVAGFVRPIILPMTIGAVESKGEKINEKHLEEIKGMSSGMENITWFFFQVLFVGGAGALLVQSTLASIGYEVELLDLAIVQIPIAIFALIVAITYYILKDRKLVKKYYGDKK